MIKDPYRRTANFYDRLFEPMNKGLRSLGLHMFPPVPDMKILDVGCGTGVHLEMYRKYGCELYGIDTSPSMLSVARARLGKDADLRLGEATEMPFENDLFDLIVCMLVLHEMDQGARTSAIGEMRRVLKPDGSMLMIDFHAGRVQPLKGWWTKLIIFLSEVAAGQRHFRNYRHFMSIRGLTTLIEDSRLGVNERKVVGGGALVLYLLRCG
jgi:ubiquinone/menaquinone biosynthesis C-methylase UbiE